jgi:hypothetical protein
MEGPLVRHRNVTADAVALAHEIGATGLGEALRLSTPPLPVADRASPGAPYLPEVPLLVG